MKKLLEIIFLGVLLSACSHSNTQKYMGLKGEIESVKDIEYDVVEKFGEAEPDDIENVYVYNFDKDGHLIKVALYDEDGINIFTNETIFENGDFLQGTFKSRYEELPTIKKLIETDGENSKCEVRKGDDITLTEFTKSDKYGLTITKKDGKIIEKQEDWYDDDNNIIETKIAKGKDVTYWIKSKFDKNHNEVQCKRLAGGDEGVFIYSYSDFDNLGNWTKKMTKKDDEFTSITKREIKYAK